MLKRDLKKGDRVRVFGWMKERAGKLGDEGMRFSESGRVGTISLVWGAGELVVNFDDGTSSEVHSIQCRMLVKKERREWVLWNCGTKGVGIGVKPTGSPYLRPGEEVVVREVRKRKAGA